MVFHYDMIGYAELVKGEAGRLVRHFMQDEQEPGDDVNTGRLLWKTYTIEEPKPRAKTSG